MEGGGLGPAADCSAGAQRTHWGPCSNTAPPVSESAAWVLNGVIERVSYVVHEKFFYSIFHTENVLSSRINTQWQGWKKKNVFTLLCLLVRTTPLKTATSMSSSSHLSWPSGPLKPHPISGLWVATAPRVRTTRFRQLLPFIVITANMGLGTY